MRSSNSAKRSIVSARIAAVPAVTSSTTVARASADLARRARTARAPSSTAAMPITHSGMVRVLKPCGSTVTVAVASSQAAEMWLSAGEVLRGRWRVLKSFMRGARVGVAAEQRKSAEAGVQVGTAGAGG